MRLWHQKLISYLPRQQLLGQHRECCALRGKGWGKKHSVVNYVFKYHKYRLFIYHRLIMDRIISLGYKVSKEWENPNYRGQKIGYEDIYHKKIYDYPIYPEHDDTYLQECLDNLKGKGINIEVKE